MSFLSRGSSSPTLAGTDAETRKQQVMTEVRSQLALANAQELINKMNEKCFAKCILKPGPSLTSSEEGCLVKCTDRFLEAFNIVSRSYVTRIGKEREQGGLSMGGDGLM